MRDTWFTVLVHARGIEGAFHIVRVSTTDMGTAMARALDYVASGAYVVKDWGGDIDKLSVLGVIEGDARILYWEDM
jgi:hypothetical protein